jgi:nitrate reductase gamma subunit
MASLISYINLPLYGFPFRSNPLISMINGILYRIVPLVVLIIIHWRSKFDKKRVYFQIDNLTYWIIFSIFFMAGDWFFNAFQITRSTGLAFRADLFHVGIFLLLGVLSNTLICSVLGGVVLLFSKPRPSWMMWK